jgi:hypothetical protein
MAITPIPDLKSLLNPPAIPCVSVYLSTLRRHPDSQQNPLRLRHLVHRIEQTLGDKYPTREVNPLLDRFRQLTTDHNFWAHPQDGLAILAAGNQFSTIKIPRPVPELVVVSDSFHLKPLLRHIQSADRFHVLGLTRTEARIYEGNRYGLEELPDGLPTFAEAVGEELTEPQRASLDRGGRMASTGHHSGMGARKDELDVDTEKWFRAVRNAVLERFSRPTGLPLVLVALANNAGHFLQMAQNPHLIPDPVPSDPGPMTREQIRAAAWEKIEPRYLERLNRLVNDYHTAHPRKMSTSDPAEIAKAAMAGRVGLVLVDADKQVPGRVGADGSVEFGSQNGPVDDLLDDLSELILRTGGEVVVVPTARMPTDVGIAAIFRY